MSGTYKDWTDLARLTGTAFDAAAGRMKLLRQRETALRSTLAAIETDRKSRAETTLPDDVAQRAGADVLWQHWIDRRREALNAELARTLVQIEAARVLLARANGRHEATENLARLAKAADRANRENRVEREW